MEEKKKCSQCSKNKLTGKQWMIIALGMYMLATSIYGTVILFHKIFG